MYMSLKLRENILRLMHKKGLNQIQLSRLAKISPSTLHGYLNPGASKQTKIDVLKVKKICEVLDADLHEMLFGEPDPNSRSVLPQEVLQKIFEGDLRVTIHKIDKKK